MDDFEGPRALAAHLIHLTDTPSDYLRYFEWRREGWARAPWFAAGYRTGLCRLCERLANESEALASAPPPLIADFGAKFRADSRCDDYDGGFAERWSSADEWSE